MNGATYHVTTPAQLQRIREEQRRADDRLVRTVERMAQLSRAILGQPSKPSTGEDA